MKIKKKSTVKKVILSLILIILTLVLIFGLVLYAKIDKNIDIALIKKGGSSVTKVFYFDYENRSERIGEPKELTEEAIFSEISEWKSIYDMPKNLKNAFIAIEDKRFYEHNGVDWLRTAKAFLNYLFKFDKSGYGGSTITQQLIKNITGENDFSPKRKVEEIFRAINLEKSLGKNEILEAYLNVVYMSQNCYGVGAASKLYFNKNVEDLSLAECATLASIVQNPSKFDPYSNLQNNVQRRNLVLKEMLSQNLITKVEYQNAIKEKLIVSDDVKNNRTSGIYSWYTEALINEICKDLSAKYNLNVSAARNLILKGGYNIYSVMNPELQNYAEKVYANYKAYIDNQNGTYPESSCVVIDPYTSDVLAIVGGVGKKNGNLIFNRAIDAKRPIGSVIKPLSVYLPGLEEGILNYSTVYDDTPLQLANGEYWPKNSPNIYRGLMPISYAISHSVNTVAVKALRDLGTNKSIEYLGRFGINVDPKSDNNDSSLALGQLTNGDNLLNVTNAYTMLVNGGSITTPKTYLYVTDSLGNKILDKGVETNKVISKENAYIMTKMLCGVVNEGTASFIKLKNKISTAGKTGTTSNNEDKWFVGYTPYYVCGVWTGYDSPKPMYYTKNPSCVLFDEIMKFAHEDLDLNRDFEEPIGIIKKEFCFDSGEIPTRHCENDIRGDRTNVGYYKFGNSPKEKCHLHKSVDIDIENGYIVEGYTPFWKKRRVSLLDYNRIEQTGIAVADDEYLIKSRKKN